MKKLKVYTPAQIEILEVRFEGSPIADTAHAEFRPSTPIEGGYDDGEADDAGAAFKRKGIWDEE